VGYSVNVAFVLSEDTLLPDDSLKKTVETKLMRILVLGCYLPLLVLASLPAAAQEQEPPPNLEATRPEKIQDPLLLEPEELVALNQDVLACWPEERGARAADMIFAGGKDTVGPLMLLLGERDYRIKPAVADILSRLGHVEAYEPIRELVFHEKLRLKTKHIFTALFRLEPGKTLGFCFELLTAEQRTLRKAAFAFMSGKKDLSAHRETALGLIASTKGDVRRHAFRLLPQTGIDPAEMNAVALSLLGDVDARLADEVRLFLASQDSDEVTKGLFEKSSDEEHRIFAHAVLATVTRESRLGRSDLSLELFSRLEQGLDSRDPLTRICAAAGLASLYPRLAEQTEDPAALRRRIVPAFMEVFLGGQYCKDFSCLLDVSALCLRHLTGAPFEKDLTFWKRWWQDHSQEFQEQPRLLALTESLLHRLVVSYENDSGYYPLSFTLAGEGVMKDPEFSRTPLTCFVTDEAFKPLLDELFTSHFFDQPSDDRSPDSHISRRVISLAVDNRSARLVIDESSSRPQIRLEETLLKIFRSCAWQLLFRGDAFDTWYFENIDRWSDVDLERERTQWFLKELFEGFNLMSEEVLLGCIDWLCHRSDLSRHFGREEWGELAGRLRGRRTIDSVVKAVVDLVVCSVSGSSSSTTGEENPAAAMGSDLFEPLVNYLFGMYGVVSYPLICRAILGTDRLHETLRDERWFVRASAARLLVRQERNALPLLVSYFDDPNSAVRIEAFRSLGRIGTVECRKILLTMFQQQKPDTLREILTGLEGIREPWVFEIFHQALLAYTADAQVEALRGLAHFDQANTEDLLRAHLKIWEPGSEGWTQVVIHLSDAGGLAARNVLYRQYTESARLEDKTFLLHTLARLGDMRVVHALLGAIDSGNDDLEVPRSLSLLLVHDFPKEPWKFREYWNTFQGEDQAFFLRKALKLEKVEDLAPGQSLHGIAVDLLVEALTDFRWYVRAVALQMLEDGLSRSFGRANLNASRVEMNQIRYTWESWLACRDEETICGL